MNIDRLNTRVDEKMDITTLSLTSLIERVVYDSDSDALRELHDHRFVFRLKDSKPIRLAEFILGLRRKITLDPNSLLDDAYDLTIDKFSHLPASRGAQFSSGQRLIHPGPDCRCYFKAFLNHYTRMRQAEPTLKPIREDDRAAAHLQGLVIRHFYLSLLECRRRINSPLRWYVWRVRE
ncbi:MAG: hypothetical protein JXR73_16180, partial [Candidatus Omnitrophica bacterium]|nr:hypothetical protein [Candidatus Omnitrophota bacterium]